MLLLENNAVTMGFLEEVWNQRNVAVLDDVFTTDFLEHSCRR